MTPVLEPAVGDMALMLVVSLRQVVLLIGTGERWRHNVKLVLENSASSRLDMD